MEQNLEPIRSKIYEIRGQRGITGSVLLIIFLPSVKIRSFLWGRSQAVFPADGRFVWSSSETEK